MGDFATDQTVYVDTREQTPLIFPSTIYWSNRLGATSLLRIHTESKCLETGDYSPTKHEGVITADTKRSMRELHDNLVGRGRIRFLAALDRMRGFRAAAIVLQFPQGEATRTTKIIKKPHLVMDALYQECFARSIQVFWSYHLTERYTGEAVLRWLLNWAYLVETENRVKTPQSTINGLLKNRSSKLYVAKAETTRKVAGPTS